MQTLRTRAEAFIAWEAANEPVAMDVETRSAEQPSDGTTSRGSPMANANVASYARDGS